MKIKLKIALPFLGLTAVALLAAGCGSPKASSSLASTGGVAAASTTTESSLPSPLYGPTGGIDQATLTALSNNTLAENLQTIGIIPSSLHQFVNFDVKLKNLNGCQTWNGPASCYATTNIDVVLTVTIGSTQFDSVTRTMLVTSLTPAVLRSSLNAMFQLELNAMMDHGLLNELGITSSNETPFF